MGREKDQFLLAVSNAAFVTADVNCPVSLLMQTS